MKLIKAKLRRRRGRRNYNKKEESRREKKKRQRLTERPRGKQMYCRCRRAKSKRLLSRHYAE